MRFLPPLVLALTLAACGGGDEEPRTTARICERLQSCNLLQGVTASDCAERIDREVEEMTTVEREDFDRNLSECLEQRACANFVACASTVPGA